MKYKTIAIIGGYSVSEDFVSEIKKASYIIACDRGAYWLLNHTIIPNEAVGDFDSVSKEQMQLITECVPLVRIYPKEKDYTDLELALECATQLKPKEIVIYGAIGGRLDHTLGAFYLLEQYKNVTIKITCIDEQNQIELVKKQSIISKNKTFKYYSLIPLTDNVEVSLKGFKYALHKAILKRGKTIGISNELISSKGIIIVYTGYLLLISSRDSAEEMGFEPM